MNYNYKITEILANKELFDWIVQAKQMGKEKFIWQYSQKLRGLCSFIVEQLQLENKVNIKLPSWQNKNCLFTQRSFEQSTAEKVAKYKSELLSGRNLLVLGGGLGVDEWAFSKTFETIDSIDNDTDLNDLVSYNYSQLDITNIKRIAETAENYLINNGNKYSAIYIDPDRRNEDKRQILLEDHQPNVIHLMPLLLEKTDSVWIKCSPLYDVSMALKELKNVKNIYCISMLGEVKEMLIQIEKDYKENTKIIGVDILKETIKQQVFLYNDNKVPEEAQCLKGYLFEVGSCIVKMRKHHNYAAMNNLKLIDTKVPFYVGNTVLENFIGKCFKIIEVINFNNSELKSYFKKEKMTHINAKIRGIPYLDTKDFYKKTGLKEGGDIYAWICPFINKKIVIICNKV